MIRLHFLLLTLLLWMNAVAICAKGDADTVRIETCGNYITVPVMLNGKPKRFILDTGCAANVVFRHALDSMEMTATNAAVIESSTGKSEAAERMMARLKVSSLDSDEMTPVYVTDVDSIMMLRGDGIVGMQYILGRNSLCMKIDARAKRAIFTTDKHFFDKEGGWKLRTKILDGRIVTKLKVSPDIKVKNVVLDTGCDHLFALSTADFDKIMSHRRSERFAYQVLGKKLSRMGGMYGLSDGQVTSLRLDRLTIAELNFHGIETETGKESLLGFPLLQTASIVYYSNGRRIKVSPYTTVRDYKIVMQEEEVRRNGYTITYENETVTP